MTTIFPAKYPGPTRHRNRSKSPLPQRRKTLRRLRNRSMGSQKTTTRSKVTNNQEDKAE